jgi:hypothetical protein
MANFMDNIKTNLKTREKSKMQRTENGALGYSTTGKHLLDLNFKVSSYRNDDSSLIPDFDRAFQENKTLALKWLFYTRDIREGLGERDIFTKVFSHLIRTHRLVDSNRIKELIYAIPEYGRWKDVFDLYEILLSTFAHSQFLHNCIKIIERMVADQLASDITNMGDGKPISLLAKWAPRENCSNKSRKLVARALVSSLGMSQKWYRQKLSKLNKYLRTLEVKASEKQWDKIDYESVPSKANLKYKDAFLRNDRKRRLEYLSKLSKGEAKMNMSVAFPHEIVHQYINGRLNFVHDQRLPVDDALEGAWKNLPDVELSNTIVVGDSSASMMTTVGNTSVSAITIAHALGLYCGDHNSGPFKNKLITFSNCPKFIDWEDKDTLATKILRVFSHSEVANTDIKAVFELILDTAIKHRTSQEDMPKTVLVISDCEFDGMMHRKVDTSLFEEIAEDYRIHDYELPRLCFLNLCSRSKTIPIQENENGVILMSGFSTQLMKMLYSNKTDPYEVLCETLSSERYKNILWS